jgi:hypothetical protein
MAHCVAEMLATSDDIAAKDIAAKDTVAKDTVAKDMVPLRHVKQG